VRTERVASIDSTLLELQRRLRAGALPADGLALLADEQDGGIGRLGRAWASPPGGLWLTIAMPCPAPPRSGVALAVAVEIAQCLDATLQNAGSALRCRIKWPNDLMLDDRKLGGVLIQAAGNATDRWMLIGIGLNLNNGTDTLPPSIAPRSVALAEFAGQVDVHGIAHAVIDRVCQAIGATDPHGFLADARSRLWGLDRDVPITLPDFSKSLGRMLELREDASLLVRFADGERVLHSVHEVHW
jgi:BirA family transcriptional regulator, biotin operon repressor / biotin---[acetyl-CoA-carboxylase] ligase